MILFGLYLWTAFIGFCLDFDRGDFSEFWVFCFSPPVAKALWVEPVLPVTVIKLARPGLLCVLCLRLDPAYTRT